ncbi:MAG: hypothetical protein ACRDMX_07815, partial [Solirubrobacteraceae bacterium]
PGAGICTPSKATNLCAIVVPDGVSHVTVGALATHDAVAIKNADAVRASVPVRDNVASFTVPALAASSRTLPRHLYFVDVTADVTWSAGGRAIRHTATPLELTARIGHNAPIPGPDSAIPSAAQCARELASCRAMGP